MPLIVKDFQWEESETMIWITVPLKGVKSHKVDIFSSQEYLKVNYSPYLFECCLAGQVDDTKGTAQITNGAVVFRLYKKEPGIWGKVKAPESDDREFMTKKREEAQARVQQRIEEESTRKAENRRLHEKLAINEMMKIEENERNRISSVKESERAKATEDLERWKEEQRLQAEKEKQRLLEAQKEEIEQEKEKNREERKRQKRIRSGNIFEKADKTTEKAPLRENGKIVVTHTARVFPTPVRESQTPQEEEWLKKQADAKKTIQLSLDKDLSAEEQNPQWLQDKGNSFFSSGDFKSAINAYSHAIHLTPKLPSLYSNRAACHLKLRNFFKCIEDCSKALDLLHPPVPQNAASRCKALIRRGSAFCQLELYVEGLRDYEGALAIDKNNESIAKDAERIRQVIQSTAED